MKKICSIIIVLFCLSPYLYAQWFWDINRMNEIKKELHTFTYANAYRTLIKEAEAEVPKGLYSVTDKEATPPSGDKRDYMSLSRYWWPDPAKKDGMPYIHKDGQSNPELEKYDRNKLGDMAHAINILSLAYFYSNDEKYASKATEILRTWFLNEKTRMNPNLNYSQFIPGKDGSKGNAVGLIDSYSFVEMLNSIQLLKNSKSYTHSDETGLKQWFADFAKWFQNSELGKKEDAAKNNHGTSYDSQLTLYLLFSGQTEAARKVINEFPEKRIFKQIEPDGKQPNELWRTLAFGYSQYNLSHMLDLFSAAKSLGINIYQSKSADDRYFYKAVDYLAGFLGKDVSEWPYQQISGWDGKQQELCNDLLRISQLDPSRTDYLELYKRYNKTGLYDRNLLLYGATNPIEDILSFAGNQFDFAFTCIEKTLIPAEKKNLVNPRSEEKDGTLRMVSSRDWCSGFFPGSLWFMYRYSEKNYWKEKAEKYTTLIEDEKFDRTSHDVGFKMFNSFGNGYLLTNEPHYKEVVIQSAKTLSERFNSKIGSIRSWDWNRNVWQYPVIVDNMLNLELLFEASKMTGDSSFYHIADQHAATTLKNHFRPDYSSYHVVDYDTLTGKVIKKQTFQGFADHSAWARGQAWGLYGFTMTYRYTQKKEYLAQAEHIAEYIFTNPNLPDDLIPYWDFHDPSIPNAPRDASAACIIASALYEMANYNQKNKEQYTAWADQILANLIQNYRAEKGTHQGFLLLHSTGNHPGGDEIDVPICYADYYFLEALLRRGNQ